MWPAESRGTAVLSVRLSVALSERCIDLYAGDVVSRTAMVSGRADTGWSMSRAAFWLHATVPVSATPVSAVKSRIMRELPPSVPQCGAASSPRVMQGRNDTGGAQRPP
jgi:hypothetical protein